MSGYVGYQQVDATRLKELADHLSLGTTYYFLRWAHQVSGIVGSLPSEFPSPEGQLFNKKLELRWKRKGEEYSILLLSKNAPDQEMRFQSIDGRWKIHDRNAYCYDSDETKFPKGFRYLNAGGQPLDPKTIGIGQRYFIDTQTSIVHFIALTLK
ncbi:MAG: hypothetical protein HC936_01175 [Leptolyngbyaceae cyanobacterium SU_3_3]|nr:hypothetical protein [Leptolyngbyaceae cyanobacterium SU_3_3]